VRLLGVGGVGVSEEPLVLRPFEPGDELAVNDSFNRVFGRQRTLDEWSWKFPLEPGGRPIMLALRGGELLAHYAGAPVRFLVDGRVWPAAQNVDVFSAPGARGRFSRRGLWVQTAERFFATFSASGRYPLLYGFPGRRSLRLGVLQLGYDAVAPQPIAYLSRPVAPRRRGLRSRFYRAELARDWEPRLDLLWDRVCGQYPVAVVRDAERALRRLAGHPRLRYHRFLLFPRLSTVPVGYLALYSDGDGCRWVDLVWDHDHPGALELAGHLAGRVAAGTGAGHEELWLNGDPEGHERLVAMGFAARPEPNGLVMVARSFAPELDVAALDGRVYLTMADADLV